MAAAGVSGLAGLGYYLVVTGKLTIDTGWGRRVRPLGPFGVQIAAPAATVFDVIAAPYLGRTPRAMSGKLQVLRRACPADAAGGAEPDLRYRRANGR